MADGRRERIVVSCITFDTVKISDPIIHYEATKVHLIHYLREDSPSVEDYRRFYNHTVDLIRGGCGDIPIVEHDSNVTDFSEMLKTVYNILRDEYDANPNADIFINISAGSSEYAAASMMSSMMFPTSIPFTVSTKEYHVPTSHYYLDDIPVGLARSVKTPKTVQRYNIEPPDRSLVLGLSILNHLTARNRAPKGPEVISNLKKNGLWFRPEFPLETRSRTESVYYYRDFVKRWEELGWIYKDDHERKYYLSNQGESIIDTFYINDQKGIKIVDK